MMKQPRKLLRPGHIKQAKHKNEPRVDNKPDVPTNVRGSDFANNDFFENAMATVTGDTNMGYITGVATHAVGKAMFKSVENAGVLNFRLNYYFAVSNNFVLQKFGLLFFPFFNKNWKRISNEHGFDYATPVCDVNAPDGYMPLMALVSYIVIIGFVAGINDGINEEQLFTPQILVSASSAAFGGLIFESILMKLGFYLIGVIGRKPPNFLDCGCYAGYKLVFVTLNLLIFSITKSWTVYYVVSTLTCLLATVFIIQTLNAYFMGSNGIGNGIGLTAEAQKFKNVFLLCVGLWQIAFIHKMARN